jgi:LmbE family N-acetylglucosaminyl deacetylase
MRYRDGSLADIDRENIISYVTHAIQRLSPQVIITFGPDGISGHPDHVAISSLVTEAFDRATLKSYLPASRLYFIAPSEATLQGCGVTPSQEIAGGPVASIDITDYRLAKVRAMQAHVSQDPPFKGKPKEDIENLACHEYFTLARPLGKFADADDIFAPLKELS